MKNTDAFQAKVKVLTKLFASGYVTEKELQNISMESVLQIPGITISDMQIIIDLQKQTKAGKLYSYLGMVEE